MRATGPKFHSWIRWRLHAPESACITFGSMVTAAAISAPLPLRSDQFDRARAASAARFDRPKTAADPRWVLAAAAMTALEGGRGAILRPDRRRRLMTTAAAMGLREFDASLIIAIVQDAARRGEPLNAGAARSLAMVNAPAPVARARVGSLLAIAAIVGIAWAVVLIELIAR
jgi:hypothetical protein